MATESFEEIDLFSEESAFDSEESLAEGLFLMANGSPPIKLSTENLVKNEVIEKPALPPLNPAQLKFGKVPENSDSLLFKSIFLARKLRLEAAEATFQAAVPALKLWRPSALPTKRLNRWNLTSF